MTVGIIRRKPVLTYASVVYDVLASMNSVTKISIFTQYHVNSESPLALCAFHNMYNETVTESVCKFR